MSIQKGMHKFSLFHWPAASGWHSVYLPSFFDLRFYLLERTDKIETKGTRVCVPYTQRSRKIVSSYGVSAGLERCGGYIHFAWVG